MRIRRVPLSLALLSLLTVLTAGCKRPASADVNANGGSQSSPAPNAGPPGGIAPFDQPVAPPGIIVCEPIPTGVWPDIARFGTGCGRWLHITVAGLPECGRSPVWASVSRVARELKLPNVRMNLQQARKAARAVGVGAVAVGSVTQNGAQCMLAWRVYLVESGIQIGATPTLRGSREQIRKGLPEAARVLANALRMPGAALPTSVELSVEDLTLIGGTAWTQTEELPSATYRRLKQLATRSPLAFVEVAQDVRWQGPMASSNFADAVSAAVIRNTLAIGEMVRVDPAANPSFVRQVDDLASRYPENYVLGKSSGRFYRGAGSGTDAVALAEAGTRSAPGNADSWLTLSAALQGKAQSIRQGVYWNQMTQEQVSAVVPLYEQAVAAAEQAVKLDPLWAAAWNDLSGSAANISEAKADEAYRKALALDPDDYNVLWWGLELYQPKWLDDPTMLQRVAALAAKKNYSWPLRNYKIHQGLLRAGYEREAHVMLLRALEAHRRYVDRHPKDLTVRFEYARALKRYGHTSEAKVQEQIAERVARERGIHLVGRESQ